MHPTSNRSRSSNSYLQRTVFIEQNICWFQITMNDRGGMEILQPCEHLIQEGLDVFRREVLRRHDKLV